MNAAVSAVVVAEVVEEEVGEVAVAATTTITTMTAAATTTTTMAVEEEEEEEATRTGVEAAAITVATKEVTVGTKAAMAVLLLHSLVPAVTLLLLPRSLQVTFPLHRRVGFLHLVSLLLLASLLLLLATALRRRQLLNNDLLG
jgi:hypothetical protein